MSNDLMTSDSAPDSNPAAIKTPAAKTTIAEFNQLLLEHHPFAKLLGIKIIDIGFGTAKLALPSDPNHQRLGGIVAGPMLMGLADLAMYAAVVGATGDPQAVTASLTMNFLRKSPPGTIYAYAKVLKSGRLCAGEVLLMSEHGGEALAHSISTWARPAKK